MQCLLYNRCSINIYQVKERGRREERIFYWFSDHRSTFVRLALFPCQKTFAKAGSELLIFNPCRKERWGYQYPFSTPCPRHFQDDTPDWSKPTSRYLQAYFLILENTELPEGRNTFCSCISKLNCYTLFVQIVSEGTCQSTHCVIFRIYLGRIKARP